MTGQKSKACEVFMPEVLASADGMGVELLKPAIAAESYWTFVLAKSSRHCLEDFRITRKKIGSLIWRAVLCKGNGQGGRDGR